MKLTPAHLDAMNTCISAEVRECGGETYITNLAREALALLRSGEYVLCKREPVAWLTTYREGKEVCLHPTKFTDPEVKQVSLYAAAEEE